eukprot:TRINITY_DN8035_c0_g1_i5.p1 TRINITY_DN8035_c0_g1~~TRINITY_DN8035_c0_g1_i5.p1  ORF type:complete len:421 (-),score=162.34 TRINITY_DN8035_c0_g1_i5:142-1404(-)
MPRSSNKKTKLTMVGMPAKESMYEYKTQRDGAFRPLMIRDPFPKRGLLQFQATQQTGDGVASLEAMKKAFLDDSNASLGWEYKFEWLELFVVIERSHLYFYRPECMFTGFNPRDALASIHIPEIINAETQSDLDILDLHTKSGKVYRFHSQQKGEVARWGFAIMHGSIYNADGADDEGADGEDADNDIWKRLNERNQASGGLDSAISKPADRLEESENAVLRELFKTIMNSNAAAGSDKKMPNPDNPSRMIDADYFDTADLMKWCSNRLNACADKKRRKAIEKVVTQDSIEEAVNSCMVHDHENTGHLTYEVFRGGMCDFTSKMREVVLTMLNTFDKLEDWEYLEKVSGELTTQEYIVMYHRHLQQVAKACRKQLHQDDDEDVFITNKKQVIQAKLNGVEKEVEGPVSYTHLTLPTKRIV